MGGRWTVAFAVAGISSQVRPSSVLPARFLFVPPHCLKKNGTPAPRHCSRDIREQCRGAGVPFFFKQWGGTNKKRAGRTLDGRTWDEMPATAKATVQRPPIRLPVYLE